MDREIEFTEGERIFLETVFRMADTALDSLRKTNQWFGDFDQNALCALADKLGIEYWR